jgi:hypothetical protein
MSRRREIYARAVSRYAIGAYGNMHIALALLRFCLSLLTTEQRDGICVRRWGHHSEGKTNMQRVAVLAAMTLALSSGCAFAVSEAVKNACTSDFAAYCSQHKVGTEAARACMREHRKMLTAECIQALGHSSEVTQADIDLYKREHNQ